MATRQTYKLDNGKQYTGYLHESGMFLITESVYSGWQVFTLSGDILMSGLRTLRSTEKMLEEITPYAKLALDDRGKRISIYDLNFKILSKAVRVIREKYFYA